MKKIEAINGVRHPREVIIRLEVPIVKEMFELFYGEEKKMEMPTLCKDMIILGILYCKEALRKEKEIEKKNRTFIQKVKDLFKRKPKDAKDEVKT